MSTNMDVHSYRAGTLQEALALVRRELGPEAAVLHTREVRSRMLGVFPGRRQIEILASNAVNVPSRLPRREPVATTAPATPAVPATLKAELPEPPPATAPPRPRSGAQRRAGTTELAGLSGARPGRGLTPERLEEMLGELTRRTTRLRERELPPGLFEIYTELLDADWSEGPARELVARLRDEVPRDAWGDSALLRQRICLWLETDIRTTGPLVCGAESPRVVAMVGPTGVGKTTTIAKLAAQYRLREGARVGLITVDTYRIAAVEQLRTYADIIDLPMEVVATPREMRAAVERLADLELVLIDTAGRSPRDEVQLRELRSFLEEARADEVHLVLSSVAGGPQLVRTAEQFASVGTTALVITKLDEAGSLAHLGSLVRGGLPISYLTDGQNVPDDIAPAQAPRLARLMLGTAARGAC